jgi:2-desacetyl-2-hydroxyethyl bacteriochlorophyllide A dehydrogenase
MRAAIFPTPEVCEIVERETPIPEEGQVLLRVEACGVCGTDLHIFRGEFPARFPIIAGHEFAGVVENVGQAVAALRPGDRVVVDPNVNCGLCRPCQRGLTHLCRNLQAYGVTADGGFATHCCLPARQCYQLPPGMPFPVAAMTEPVACCVHGIERARVRPGDVVAIIGAGLIGLVLLQLSLLRGAAHTIVSEPAPDKRDLAHRLGAAELVDPTSEDLAAVVRRATDGGGANVVIDCVGGVEPSQQAVSLAGEGGRVLLFGVAPESARIAVQPYTIYRKEITITGSFTNPSTHAAALALLAAGRIKVAEIISHKLPLDELLGALKLIQAGQARKIVIEPQM